MQVKERASVNELRERLDIDNLKLSDPDNEDINAKQRQKNTVQEQEKKAEVERQELLDTYKKHPELKGIDQELTEVVKRMSKAVLCKNKTLLKKLEKEKARLLQEREKYEKNILFGGVFILVFISF